MTWNERLRLMVGAVLVAATLLALMAVPGFLSDLDATMPLHPVQEAQR